MVFPEKLTFSHPGSLENALATSNKTNKTIKKLKTMSEKECPICCDQFTAQVRKPVKCNYCEKDCCVQCVKRYLLETKEDPHCMSCKATWNQEFIDSALTKSFRNGELKKHRETVLLDREQSFLPASQAALEAQLFRTRRLKELIQLKNALKQQLWEIEREMRAIQYGDAQIERKKFIRKCPVDDCRGFLSSQWKCGVCEGYTCKECYEPKAEQNDPDHECNPESVATAKLLEKDCKPCPGCGVFTHKIAGCSQMWCTDCHTAWDYNSGTIVKSRIHNPHYYEWQRAGGNIQREHGDVVCGGLPNIKQVQQALVVKEPNSFRKGGFGFDVYGKTDKDEKIIKQIDDCHRFVTHTREVILNEFRVVVNPELNQDLRFKYLQNEIDKKKWGRLLATREKKRLLKTELYQLYEMFANVAEESYRKLVGGQQSPKETVAELKKLRDYVNEQAGVISKRYNAVVTTINTNTNTNKNHYIPWNMRANNESKWNEKRVKA